MNAWRPPRVLACCGGVFRLGGLERMTLQVLQLVADRGGRVHCIFNRWTNAAVLDVVDQMGATRSRGAYATRLGRRTGPIEAVRGIWDVCATSAGFLRDAARFRPTHVLVPEFAVVLRNWPALMVCRAIGIPVVLAVQNAPAPGTFYRRVWKWLVDPAVTRYVCASDDSREQLRAHGIAAAKTSVVFNTAAHPQAPGRAAPVGPPVVLFIGQLIPEKGLDLLLDAVALVASRAHDVQLQVIGDTDAWVGRGQEGYRDTLFARAAQPDLHGRVQFLGWRDDVPARLRDAAVHCLPSRPEMCEGLPLSVVEAKEAGVPTVAFDHGPFPELIDHTRTGWLCRERTPAALAEGLEWFLADPDRRKANAHEIRASAARFSREAFAAGWWSVLAGEEARAGAREPAAPVAPAAQTSTPRDS